MAVYIDDVGEMSPSEFNTAKIYLRQLWKMANKDPNRCQEVGSSLFTASPLPFPVPSLGFKKEKVYFYSCSL